MSQKRYELQIKHTSGEWVAAGNFPARTRAEGLRWLGKCAELYGWQSHRIVSLHPRVIAVRKGKSKR